MAALWAHDVSRPLARVGNGTLKLRSDNVGLYYSIIPNAKSPLGQEAIAIVGPTPLMRFPFHFRLKSKSGTIRVTCLDG
ncbi:HK97 family phage prohead protease [Bradyrhizobium ottawaense]